MFAGRPIIGIAGGIGAGKSFIADLFGELGCHVLRSDDHAHAAYKREDVQQALRAWWGPAVFAADGSVNRRAVGEIVFNNPVERARLEGLIHPIVNAARSEEMTRLAGDPRVVAWVWDVPLLFETGLNRQCDSVVFVEASEATRLARVRRRGWDEAELKNREKSQLPLDKKRSISDDLISNDDGIDVAREQVRHVLSRILTRHASPTPPDTR